MKKEEEKIMELLEKLIVHNKPIAGKKLATSKGIKQLMADLEKMESDIKKRRPYLEVNPEAQEMYIGVIKEKLIEALAKAVNAMPSAKKRTKKTKISLQPYD